MTSGVVQVESGFSAALKQCGTADKNGDTIGIVNVSGLGLRLIPLALRLVGLIILLAMVKFQTPLAFLPGDRLGIEWLSALEHWEVFTTGTWLLAVGLYVVYLATTVLRTSLYRGVPGLDILFSRYGKIVNTVKPGSVAAILDPRVHPSAVVSRKPMVLSLDSVTGPAKENVKITTTGSLVIRVADSFRLFEQGGFETFLKEIHALYESLQRDRILQFSAKEFNRYMIEQSHGTARPGANLDRLEGTQLSVALMTELSEVGELDVSRIQLTEPSECARKSILPALAQVAERYGIEVLDYIPQGNLTDTDNFRILALRLVQSIQRLHQASTMLTDTLEQEIEQDITAAVAGMERGLLGINRLCGEITSVTATLHNDAGKAAIIASTCRAMANQVTSILAEYLASVDALVSRVQAKQIDTAGFERYAREMETILASFEAEIQSLPKVEAVVVDKLTGETLCPNLDVITTVMEHSGLATMLHTLKEDAQKNAEDSKETDAIATLQEEARALQSDGLIANIQEVLSRVSPDIGIDTDRYSPARVEQEIARIEGVVITPQVGAAETAQAELRVA